MIMQTDFSILLSGTATNKPTAKLVLNYQRAF